MALLLHNRDQTGRTTGEQGASVRIHLDTDLGGDPDDLCALAMLLGWPDVEITGITTTLDAEDMRAAYVAYCLRLARRDDIPVASGAGVSLTTLQRADPFLNDSRYWPDDILPSPSTPGAALDLLARSIDAGATVAGIGTSTNLALLEIARPGSLRHAPVVLMGGWVRPPADGLPAWGPEMDWNVQFDPRAAEIVFASATDLTLATLPATMQAQVRRADLPRLRTAGPLCELIARQSEARATDAWMPALAEAHAALPDDLLNFQFDPVACAVALGWPGATVEQIRLRTDRDGDVLRFVPDPGGRPVRVLTDVDGPAFAAMWLERVTSPR
jgi:inosine-uridine nucleoside N-ribohydrolase